MKLKRERRFRYQFLKKTLLQIKYQEKYLILISADKIVNSINIMRVTKCLPENIENAIQIRSIKFNGVEIC